MLMEITITNSIGNTIVSVETHARLNSNHLFH